MSIGLEKTVESRLTAGVKRLGGTALKWVSPGKAGVPDRIVILPGGRVVFAELKQAAGTIRPLQRVVIGELRKLGCDVRVLRGREDVDEFLREVEAWCLIRTHTSGMQSTES